MSRGVGTGSIIPGIAMRFVSAMKRGPIRGMGRKSYRNCEQVYLSLAQPMVAASIAVAAPANA
jgi:hypothetical protein